MIIKWPIILQLSFYLFVFAYLNIRLDHKTTHQHPLLLERGLTPNPNPSMYKPSNTFLDFIAAVLWKSVSCFVCIFS